MDTLKPLYLGSEDTLFRSIEVFRMQAKRHRKTLPLMFIDSNELESNQITILINKIIQWYNDGSYAELSSLSKTLSNSVHYDGSGFNLTNICYDYLDNLDISSHEFNSSMACLFEILCSLPVSFTQIKKQKTVVGFNSLTGNPIFRNFKVLADSNTDLFVNQVYYLSDLVRTRFFINENFLDVLPETFIDVEFYKNTAFPTPSEPFSDIITYIKNKKRYSIPDDGVFVVCPKKYNIKELFIKENRYFHNKTITFFKISFLNSASDVVRINIDTGVCSILPGSALYSNYQYDPIIGLCLSAYRDLVCNNEIISVTARHDIKNFDHSHSNNHFTYIPRKTYVGSLNPVRVSQSISKLPHSVSGHIRRGNASLSAIKEAEKHGIILPPGYTYVRSYRTGKEKSSIKKYKLKE